MGAWGISLGSHPKVGLKKMFSVDLIIFSPKEMKELREPLQGVKILSFPLKQKS